MGRTKERGGVSKVQELGLSVSHYWQYWGLGAVQWGPDHGEMGFLVETKTMEETQPLSEYYPKKAGMKSTPLPSAHHPVSNHCLLLAKSKWKCVGKGAWAM